MKQKFTILILAAFLFSLSSVLAAACNLQPILVNQDPYPAVPGEYVKVVFQLKGVENPECGNVIFTLNEEFPFSLKPGTEAQKTISGGLYARKYESFAMLPYEILVDNNALDGSNPIEASYSSSTSPNVIKEFTIEIEDVRTDFELSITDFISGENKISLSILNTGEADADAVVVEIPKQDNIVVKGSNKEIIGSLDSKDDTTLSFEASPREGDIKVNVIYSDEIGVRRTVEKTVYYDSSYFTGRVRDVQTTPTYYYWIVAIVVLIVIWRVWKSIAKRRKENQEKHHKK